MDLSPDGDEVRGELLASFRRESRRAAAGSLCEQRLD